MTYIRESQFQRDLVQELRTRFPGAIVLKNDASYMQGVPDLSIFYGPHWATLECKVRKTAKHQPNQDYYISKMNEMSFARVIYPENKDEVLNEMEQSFKRRS